MKILVINGPNLNLLGMREPEIYGKETLADLTEAIRVHAALLHAECDFFQSNCEGELVSAVQRVLTEGYDGCILNAGAYTHYSYAQRDAISSVEKPVIEVHISNVHAREEFRHTSVISPVCKGVIAGFGFESYLLALTALCGMNK